MLTSGEVVELDLGTPAGREAGFRHPAIVVTAQRILDASPVIVQVVPLTSTIRGFASEIEIDPDPANQLDTSSTAQCQHVRAVSVGRIEQRGGNVGSVKLTQIREMLGVMLDVPA